MNECSITAEILRTNANAVNMKFAKPIAEKIKNLILADAWLKADEGEYELIISEEKYKEIYGFSNYRKDIVNILSEYFKELGFDFKFNDQSGCYYLNWAK